MWWVVAVILIFVSLAVAAALLGCTEGAVQVKADAPTIPAEMVTFRMEPKAFTIEPGAVTVSVQVPIEAPVSVPVSSNGLGAGLTSFGKWTALGLAGAALFAWFLPSPPELLRRVRSWFQRKRLEQE